MDKSNINAHLDRVEKGPSFANQPVTDRVLLAQLGEYISAQKGPMYGDDTTRFIFHKAAIELYMSNFFDAFLLFRDYVRKTHDISRPLYHIGHALEDQCFLSGHLPLGVAALATRERFPEPLDLDQQVSILAFGQLYPYRQMAPYLSDELLNRHRWILDPRTSIAYYRAFTPTIDDIEKIYGVHILEKKDMAGLFGEKTAFDIAELDYFVAFHIHPYHQDYETATYYADLRDHKTWYSPRGEYRIVNLMRAYLGTDQYHEVLAIYNHHLPSFSEVAISVYHVNLLVSAAYAGLGDLDTALEYLEKDLALSEIYSGELSNARTISDLPQRGDMLYALYELVFVFEEFDAFEGAGRYSELEEVVERNVARYKHLRLFNR